MNRRQFFKKATTSVIALLKLYMGKNILASNGIYAQNIKKLKRDPSRVLDIHSSLKYKIISSRGNVMEDGFRVPDLADGMGAFRMGQYSVLVRNHELAPRHGIRRSAFIDNESKIKTLGGKHYDPKIFGGTTNIVFDEKNQKVLREFLSLSGTSTNCAGGITPWNTWLTCEEDANTKKHGYVYEVVPETEIGVQAPVPIKTLGRFNHEAVAFDSYQNAYLTEDKSDGLFYRFTPENRGSLRSGKLMALRFLDTPSQDTRNIFGKSFFSGKTYRVEWIRLDDIDPKKNTLRNEGQDKNAAIFCRGEGIINDQESIYFCCTEGGPIKRGQIWKYTPTNSENGVIELWYEVQDKGTLHMPDNITFSPWGDLIICEDNSNLNRIWGLTPSGSAYLIAKNSYTGAEFAGACFSPKGETLFVNLQQNGQTFAINGDWAELKS